MVATASFWSFLIIFSGKIKSLIQQAGLSGAPFLASNFLLRVKSQAPDLLLRLVFLLIPLCSSAPFPATGPLERHMCLLFVEQVQTNRVS
jgi:hypothetical protein